jgi:hypothetical protein
VGLTTPGICLIVPDCFGVLFLPNWPTRINDSCGLERATIDEEHRGCDCDRDYSGRRDQRACGVARAGHNGCMMAVVDVHQQVRISEFVPAKTPGAADFGRLGCQSTHYSSILLD